ncbi:protein of unknown function DUF166 [Methanotorris formicicus Mc-S-70]|uniref:Thymidylate synthase n=2 Tax=Methanotorris formicicus TaxID=213185 RepID=H1KWU8_9EURY|nr:protein of unknown function DUF166 [Methanotorris formicicus Mc-S-70]
MIVSDGAYGERAGNILKEHAKINEFTGFFRIPKPSNFFVDEIELPKEIVEKFKEADILITYTTHPDNTYEVCRRCREENPNIAIIVAAWRGNGQKKELQKFDAICPHIMCEIDEDNLNIEKYPKLKEFLKEFGKPKVKVYVEGGKVRDVEVLRTSICGSTIFMAENMVGMDVDDIGRKGSMLIQRYPCVAGKIHLFSDEECKKIKALTLHKEAIENGLMEIKYLRKK